MFIVLVKAYIVILLCDNVYGSVNGDSIMVTKPFAKNFAQRCCAAGAEVRL